MADFEFSGHALSMLQERNISEEWLWCAIKSPDRIEVGTDNNTYYIKVIQEYSGRVLRVVVNSRVTPKRIITVFFDRRLGRRQI